MNRQKAEKGKKKLYFSVFVVVSKVIKAKRKTFTIKKKKTSKKYQNSINMPGDISIYIDVMFIKVNQYSLQNYENFYGLFTSHL
jgi:hypothetical protein